MTNPPLVNIQGMIMNQDGALYSGKLEIRQPVTLRADDGTVIAEGRFSTQVVNGFLDIDVPFVDNVGWNPVGWAYTVYIPYGSKFSMRREYLIAPKTADGPVQDLDALLLPEGDGGVDAGTQYALASDLAELAAEVAAGGGGGGGTAGVTSVNGRAGAVTLAKADVGLTNVDNTSDINKPISNATAGALATKANSTDLASYATTSSVSTALSGKSNVGHTHNVTDVTGLQTALDGKQAAGDYATNTALAAKADQSAVDAALALKADITALSGYATTTALSTGLAGKADVSALATKADLVGGKLPTSQVPSLAIVEFLGTSADQAAMLAKVGQKGDWTIRSDQSSVYVITGDDPTQLTSWTSWAYPAGSGSSGAVNSVNGYTGNVILSKADLGLGSVDNTADVNKPVSTAQQTALDAKADTASLATVATSGAYTDLSAIPTTFTPSAHSHTEADVTGLTADLASAAGTATWTGVSGKPSTFPPSAHTHAESEITGLTTDLAAKAPLASPTFTGTVSGITKAMVGLGNVDNTADAAKTFTESQITGLTADLAAKAPIASPTFTGTVSGVTAAMVGLGNVNNTSDAAKPVSTATQTALNLKADLASPALSGTPTAPTATAGTNTTQIATTAFTTGAISSLTKASVGLSNVDNTSDANKPISTATQTALNSKADLVGGVVSTSQIPAIAVTEFLGTVASQTAMLALTGQKGDWAIRSDTGQTWVITGSDPTVIGGWTALSTPAAPVTSVNGQTGTVVLGKTDVGLGNVDNTSDVNKPVSTAQSTAIAAKVDKATLTAKGDLYVATASGTISRLGVGSDTQILTADSTQAAGVKWASPASGGNVTGPAGATDNAVVRFDTTTGQLIQNSLVQVTDAGTVVLTPLATQTYARGALYYNSDTETLTFNNNDTNVAIQVGQTVLAKVYNTTGSTIAAGTPVYASGYDATSGLTTVTAANAAAIGTSLVLGLTAESIATATAGYVLIAGKLSGLNTSAFTAGAQLYLGTTAGALTSTVPTSPNLRVPVGSVLSSNATTGAIYVNVGSPILGFGTANQIMGMNSAATGFEMKTINGTANQITVTHAANSVTLAIPSSAALPGSPTTTTPTAGDNTTKVATTAFVATSYAPLASPALTGTPTVPTATAGTNTTQAASTAFVSSAVSSLAPLASPTFTGTPAAPTATAGTSTTQLATTAFVAAAVSGISSGSSPFYNVKGTGTVKGDGTTDDTTALQAVINASPIGSTVVFPVGVYVISAPIVLPPSRTYLGLGHAYASPSAAVIQMKTGSNIANASAGYTGMFVSQGWSTNQTVCDYPMKIINMAFEGNRANNATSNACGIVMCNFWSWIQDCYFDGIPNAGICLTDTGANGTTQISNTASENKIMGCKITDTGGDGIRLISNNNNSNLDGLLSDCRISYTNNGGMGINFDRSAGWVFRNNHFYGISGDAMHLGKTFATTVDGNYVEDFGNQNGSGSYYSGIYTSQLDGRGSTVVNNWIGGNEPATNTSFYYYIALNAGAGQSDAQIVCANNTVSGAGTAQGFGIATGHEDSSGHLISEVGNNHVANIINAYPFDPNDVAMGLTQCEWDAVDQNYFSWAYDPTQAQGSTAGTGGSLYLIKLKVPVTHKVTNIVMYVGTAGATLTANQCYAGLYTLSGTLLAKTAQQATNWASTGLKVMALATSQTIKAGWYYVGFYSTGTTQPAFMRANNTGSALVNAGMTSNYRFATANTGLTTTMPTTLGTMSASGNSYWAALS